MTIMFMFLKPLVANILLDVNSKSRLMKSVLKGETCLFKSLMKQIIYVFQAATTT
jgi:hypothetical protein